MTDRAQHATPGSPVPAGVAPSAAELAARFTYHAPRGNQPDRYEQLRAAGRAFAELIVDLTPASREQAVALTKLDEVVMWSNAAIARREP